MSGFDKFCAFLACLLAAFFIVLGVPGLFLGCSFNFTLPPAAGVVPALIGWGIIRATIVAFRVPVSKLPPNYSNSIDPMQMGHPEDRNDSEY